MSTTRAQGISVVLLALAVVLAFGGRPALAQGSCGVLASNAEPNIGQFQVSLMAQQFTTTEDCYVRSFSVAINACTSFLSAAPAKKKKKKTDALLHSSQLVPSGRRPISTLTWTIKRHCPTPRSTPTRPQKLVVCTPSTRLCPLASSSSETPPTGSSPS
jgi:hypothetical protein